MTGYATGWRDGYAEAMRDIKASTLREAGRSDGLSYAAAECHRVSWAHPQDSETARALRSMGDRLTVASENIREAQAVTRITFPITETPTPATDQTPVINVHVPLLGETGATR
jgi:hypothetical protein